MSPHAEKIEHFRKRARKLRADADELTSYEDKEALVGLAANYETMAAELEKRCGIQK